MIEKAQKIHFINYMNPNNIGDWISSPLVYYFDFFKNYNIIRHDISFIDWHEIGRSDIVILGGGGLLNADNYWNNHILRLLEKTTNVVAWGVGYNTHLGKEIDTAPDIEKFKLIAIRDYEHGSKLPWLPCVSCKTPELKKISDIKRQLGIIEHHEFPIKGVSKLKLDKITNSHTIDEITDFIASSEIIITNAYHMVYFAQLMKKKVLCVNPFSSKFRYFKYTPQIIAGKITEDKIKSVLPTLELTPDALLDEAIGANDAFFEQVKELVESEIAVPGNQYSLLYNTAFGGMGSLRRELLDTQEKIKIRSIVARTLKTFTFRK